ncbi:MAG TPA: Xaa-Pro peptidase family protein [Candidatus Limnocylindrales bacterium]|nr:Xaa-Pro peptidase family protein [Candidatus Limnocylindrales bacterium]
MSRTEGRRWRDADEQARPARLARLRQRLAREGVDAYFGLRRENVRYLAGFVLEEGEEKVAGQSGHFFVTGDEVVLLADPRYREQALDECAGARVEHVYQDFVERWPAYLDSLRGLDGGGVRRLAVEAQLGHGLWLRLAAALPEVELVPADGWVEELRAVKEPSEVERIAAACAVADAALERILPRIRPGQREAEVALDLEWEIRTGGAEALAFGVTVLSGPRAALPHGSPGERAISAGEVLLFDFGAQVGGYRSDMTRTLFVGQPRTEDLAIYEVVAAAQQAALDALEAAAARREAPDGRTVDAIARSVIADAGHGEAFTHSLGHGIGLATHEAPALGRRAPETPLPTPSVFSIEPGVYLPGQTGVRIEDLVNFDPAAGRCERLTRFPRKVRVLDV